MTTISRRPADSVAAATPPGGGTARQLSDAYAQRLSLLLRGAPESEIEASTRLVAALEGRARREHPTGVVVDVRHLDGARTDLREDPALYLG